MKQLIYIWETEFDRLQAERFRKDIIEKERKRILEIIDKRIKYFDDFRNAGFRKEATNRISELLEIKKQIVEDKP